MLLTLFSDIGPSSSISYRSINLTLLKSGGVRGYAVMAISFKFESKKRKDATLSILEMCRFALWRQSLSCKRMTQVPGYGSKVTISNGLQNLMYANL